MTYYCNQKKTEEIDKWEDIESLLPCIRGVNTGITEPTLTDTGHQAQRPDRQQRKMLQIIAMNFLNSISWDFQE